jgi:hypothetical protein
MKRFLILICLCAGVCLAVAGSILAQNGGGYDLGWSTIAGGGTVSTGGGYTLMGTIGQAAAGDKLTGTGYALRGGFWNLPRPIASNPFSAVPERNFYDTATITLTWSRVTWALGYQVQVDDNDNFSSPLLDDATLTAGTQSVVFNAPFNGKFFWRVRGKINATTWSAWSGDSFRVNVP